MKIIVYIDSWNKVNKSVFAEQIKLYDSLTKTVCVDNSCDGEGTGQFLDLVSDWELNNTIYNINDEKLSYHSAISECLDLEDALIVTNRIIIDDKSILELKAVADAAERHIFVIPRSDKGDCQVFPGPEGTILYSDRLEWLTGNLPRYTLMPCTYGECIYIKSSKIKNLHFTTTSGEVRYGLKSSFESMQLGMLDMSLDVHDYGYSTVCANHAYVLGACSVFENINQNDLSLFREKVIDVYKTALKKYYEVYRSPAEKFGKCIGDKSGKRKLLLYMPNLGSTINGGSIHVLGVLSGIMNSIDEDKWEVTACTFDNAAKYHNIEERFGCKVISPENVNEIYDVGFVPFHLCEKPHQENVAKYCYKIIYWPLDLIMLRSDYLNDIDFIRNFEAIARYSDGLIYFSESVKNDMEAYFAYVENVKKIPSVVSYITYKDCDKDAKEDMPFDSYYLVMGNNFVHKMIAPAMVALSKVNEKFIFFGGKSEYEEINSNMIMMSSGGKSDEYMHSLYKNCKALIYPSVYEGFGLPPVQAMNLGKDVFVMEMPVNHELEKLAPEFHDRMHFMNSLDELPDMLHRFSMEAKEDGKTDCYKRSWDDVGKDCIDLMNKVVSSPYDAEKMYYRRSHFC